MARLSLLILITCLMGHINTYANTLSTLDAVKKKGVVQCGVTLGLQGFSSYDEETQKWSGLDVEFCRAVAAAVLGNADHVKYTRLNAKERFVALQSGEIDLLSRVTTWNMTRDTILGLRFVGVFFYEGQGFLVRKSLGVQSAAELEGATVCIQAGTTSELNLADYFASQQIQYKSLTFDTPQGITQGFETEKCDVLTSDRAKLYSLRNELADPDSAVVLPEIISKEPLGPVIRQGDTQWFNVVRWVLFTLLNAEEMTVTSHNIDEMKETSTDAAIKYMLGVEGEIGNNQLGLSNEWAYNIIKQVGNYSEIFERSIGIDSPLKIERGLNALWNKGGIHYAPPLHR